MKAPVVSESAAWALDACAPFNFEDTSD